MYVILYVMSMLMLLASLTYARIESYRASMLSQGQFEHYMQEEERGYINAQATKLYRNTVVSPKLEKEEKERANEEAAAKISFHPFIHSTTSERNQALFQKQLQLAKDLILFLYKDKKFYREKVEKDSNIVHKLLLEMLVVANDPKETSKEQKKTTTTPKMLASLTLDDKDLQELLEAMLKKDTKEMRQEADQSPTFNLKEGYLSLQDFVTLKKKSQVRLYLASPMVLMAFFNNADVVKAIISSRQDIYKEYKQGRYTKEQATDAFRIAVYGQAYGIDDTIMDFSVSKTNPKGYWISK